MRVIVFAPHNDDEVLGVGGTMAKLAAEGHEIFVCEVTSGTSNADITAKLQAQAKKAHEILGVKESIFLNLPVVRLKETETSVKNKAFCDVVNDIKPNMAFIPHVGDMHVDHQETALAAMVALRPLENPDLKAIYTYETLSETEWNIPSAANAFIPNVWSVVTDTIDKKIEAMSCFSWQLKKFPHPRSLEAIKALAQYRGSTIGADYAEAFMMVREIF